VKLKSTVVIDPGHGGAVKIGGSSPTLQVAAERWSDFLARHDPPDGEFEDGYHQHHVEAARYELLRVYYLLGRVEDGDRLMKKITPLKQFTDLDFHTAPERQDPSVHTLGRKVVAA